MLLFKPVLFYLCKQALMEKEIRPVPSAVEDLSYYHCFSGESGKSGPRDRI